MTGNIFKYSVKVELHLCKFAFKLREDIVGASKKEALSLSLKV